MGEYKIFKMGTKDHSIAGYHWGRTQPDYVVCIIHGIGEYAARYERMAHFMGETNFAVLSMDLRGHGASAGKRGHCAPREKVLGDIDALVSQASEFYPDVPIILYGHSLGGNLVLDYKMRGRLNAVPKAYVLSAPWLMLVQKIPFYLECFVRMMLKIKSDFTISAGIAPNMLGNPEMILDSEGRRGFAHNKISAETALNGYDIADAIIGGTHPSNGGAEGKPMLIMHGDQDKICYVEGSKKIAELEGDCCTYVEWSGYYHELHNGNAEKDGTEVILKVIQWIQQL